MKLTVDTSQLNQEKLALAIAALRSGKYTKHTGSLTDPKNKSAACCLMVVAQEIDNMPWEEALAPEDESWGLPGEIDFSYENYMFAVDLEDLEIQVNLRNVTNLANLNDGAVTLLKHTTIELTHPEIADLLEKGEFTIKE